MINRGKRSKTLSSAAKNGWSTFHYHQSSAFDCPYLSCNDHCKQWLPVNLYYDYFLEILLNNFELVFLESKHFYQTQKTSLFSFYLLFFYSLFQNHSVYQHSAACKHTGWVCFLFACCFAITLYIYINVLYLLHFSHS